MDGQRFDAIVRSFAPIADRRRVLKGLAGGVAGALGLALGRRSIEAARGRQCETQDSIEECNKPCRVCCGERCIYGCDNDAQVCEASSGQCVSRIGGNRAAPKCP